MLNYRRAFTMIEIIIVVVILGILAAIAVPKVIGPKEKVVSSEGQQTLIALLGAQSRYELDHTGTYAAVLGNLDITVPTSQYFDDPTVANSAAGLASVRRKTTAYTLSIDSTGVITCANGALSPTCADAKCTKNPGGNRCN